jgi:hypothetical protein
VRSRTSRPHPKPGSAQFLLTRGNVVIALVTMAATMAALGFGLRVAKTAAQHSPGSRPMSSVPAPAQQPGGAADPVSGTPASGVAAMMGLVARGGPGQAVVSWRLAGATADQVRATISGSDGSQPPSTCTPTATGCTFTRLTDGVEYTVDLSLVQGGRVVARKKVTAIPYPAVLATRATRLWFNLADPDTLLTEGGRRPAPGVPVLHVLDRSGSGADARPAPERALPTITMINGHTALAFGAVSGMPFPASSLPRGSAPGTVYAVAGLDEAEADGFAHLVFWGAARTNGSRALIKEGGSSFAFADTYNTWNQASPTRPWRSGRIQIIRAGFAADALSLWMDGTRSYTWTQPEGATMDTGAVPDGMLGGTPWDGNASWQGRIAEVIVLSTIPTADEDTAITQYLQRKWGL